MSTERITRGMWFWWIGLATFTLLNFNSVAEQAFGGHRIFTPLMFIFSLGVIIAFSSELRGLFVAPMPSAILFIVTYLIVGLFSATTAHYVSIGSAISKLPLHFATVLLVLSGMCVASRATRSNQLTFLFKSIFILASLAALSAVLFITFPFLGSLLKIEPGQRLHGVFGNVNELGLASGYPIVFGLVVTMRTRNPLWVIIGVAAGITGVISSFSKAALLGLPLTLALIPYALGGARLRLVPVLLLMIGLWTGLKAGEGLTMRILQGATGIELQRDQLRRLQSIVDLTQTGSIDSRTTTGRTVIWKSGLRDWSHSPVIGLGLGGFDKVRDVDIEIHNTILRVLGESGLIGLLTFMVLSVSLIIGIARCRQKEIHVVGVGFILVQLPLVMSHGGTLLLRNHNLITGCVFGLLVGYAAQRQQPVARPAEMVAA